MVHLPGIVMRQPPAQASVAPWYKIVNKAKSGKTVAKVYIYDAIGGWFGVEVNEFIKELNDIDADEIELHLNSPGGSVYDGIAIYNALKQHDAEVTTYIDSLAASAASFIALAGEKVIIARNATMMIHDAMGSCFGNQAAMLETADILDKVSDNIADIYAFNAGGSAEEWRALMRAETWYSAAEAVEAGLADEMTDADPAEEDEDADTENKWNLAEIFNYGGRVFAPPPQSLHRQVRNQIKEKRMATNDGTEQTSTPAPGTGPGATEGDSNEETTEQRTSDEHEEPTTPVEQPPATPQNMATGGVLTAVNIAGQSYQVPTAVANHIESLETYRNEQIEQHRRDFVTGLSTSNRILATEVENLANFALTLSDEQFSAWKASMSAAPAQSLFGQYGVEPGDRNAPTNQTAQSTKDRVAVLEDIVAEHRRSGMTQERVEATNSYKELQNLKAQLTNA